MAQHGGQNPAKHITISSGLAHDRRGDHGRDPPSSAAASRAMKTKAFNTTVLFYPNKNPKLRLFALWYFTTLMIVWNVVGHTVLGFEQSWATPLTAIATAIAVSMLLDWVDARATNRELRFTGSLGNFL